jgi:hypothetical protein
MSRQIEKKENIVRQTQCHQEQQLKNSIKESGDIIHINGNIGYSTNNNNNSSLRPYAFNCHHHVHRLRTCVH